MQRARLHHLAATSSWTPAPAVLELASHQVDLWRVQLDVQVDSLQTLEAVLSSDEKQRAARFHFQADRERFLVAHGCLRDVLSRYLHCEPDKLGFITNTYGKPALHDQQLEFNLSHSGEFALVAVTKAGKIGVDIERIRSGISSQVIARQYFSRSEFAELLALPCEEWEAGFFTCWTRKEAYIKAQGLGLSLPLESFDVSIAPGEPAILRATRPDPREAARWTLSSFEVDMGYAAALAVEGQSLEFRFWDWNAP